MNHRIWLGRKRGKAREMLIDFETTNNGVIRRQAVLIRLKTQGTGYKGLKGLEFWWDFIVSIFQA